MATKLACRDCGVIATPKSHTRGSIVVEIAGWVLFFPVGLAYSLWRMSSRRKVCLCCGSDRIVPLSSPAGKRIAATAR